MGNNKNIGRKINDFFSGWERIRVVLLGSKGTGKTVFMTSVGAQLRNHDNKAFDLRNWTAEFDQEEDDKAQGLVSRSCIKAFPYADFRAVLAKGEWPAKTEDGFSVLTVPFTLTKKDSKKRGRFKRWLLRMPETYDVTKRRRILLEMLDLPGERVADFAMLGRSYREWCTWMENRFGGRLGSSEYFKNFLKRVSALGGSDPDDKEKAIDFYKDFLADEYANLSLSITPSTVKYICNKCLYRDKCPYRDKCNERRYNPDKCQCPKEELPELTREDRRELIREGLKEVPIGKSKDLQFIPLPTASFAKGSSHSGWVKPFAKAYEAYKKSEIMPIAAWCKHANSLLYFVDVLELLRRGPEVYTTERRFAEQALGFFKHRRTDNILMKPIKGLADQFVTHLDSVQIIATKTDCAGNQGTKMLKLAQKMMEPVVRTMGIDRVEYASCAAVATAGIYKDRHAISARIKKENKIQETILVDEVPGDWPESVKWRRDFNWQDTFPLFDERVDVPPRQTGLDKIIRCVLNIPDETKK
jgi:predicted YcjX-like family ATPase